MSIKGRAIIWPAGSRIERGLAYVFGALASAFGANRGKQERISFEEFERMTRCKSSNVCVQLPLDLAYTGSFETRTTSTDAQAKIFAHEAFAQTPLESDDACVIVQKNRQLSTQVQFLQVRNETLQELENQAGRLGIENLYLSSDAQPARCMPHPGQAAQRHLERKSLTLGLALCVAGLWSVMSVLESRAENTLSLVAEEESRLRSVLLARVDENRELSALGQLAAINPEARSPQGRLQTLSDITTSTTDGTWWQHIELDDMTLRLTGRSESASASLTAVSSAFSGYEVQFADAVADAQDGDQVFTLEIRPEETLR
ncbi:MAG: hypothetical protein K0U61_09635 [Alphaproteobacteria bacterium]|nr:hypothetical protein [Alphaproteobacteria bacterium]